VALDLPPHYKITMRERFPHVGKTTVTEGYPGEVEALHHLLGDVRMIAKSGTMAALRRALAAFDDAERAARAALPWQPNVGLVYGLVGPNGEPDRFARVIDPGLWRKRLEYNDASPVYVRSSLRHEDDETGRSRPLKLSEAGRLVVVTHRCQDMDQSAQVEALRALVLPQIPGSGAALASMLDSVQGAAEHAGLVLTVSPARHLKELPGESYE